MNTLRRLSVLVTPVADGWAVTVLREDTGWQSAVRTMRKSPADPARSFPLAPADDLPGPAAGPAAALANDAVAAAALFDKIENRVQRKQSVETLGRYLFYALFGDKLWTEIRGQARGANLVELALTWDSADRDLNRLNWEVMHSGAEFLSRGMFDADGQSVRVIITRVVATAANPPPVPRQLGSSPRILYVVGARLGDPQIRAGAEYFGLFRQLRSEGGNGTRWRHLPTKVLIQASARRLESAVKDFRPDIIHFICHGEIRGGRGTLSFAPDPDHPQDPTNFTADLIFDRLKPDNNRALLPTIVILSACHTGGGAQVAASMGGPEHSAPLAAELVQLGIPIVAAMAGAVADHACRLFTRTFGAALVQGQSLLEATERGRRAALKLGGQPDQTPDWAMPVLFRSAGVPMDYGPPPPADNDEATALLDIINGLELVRDREPPLVAHEEAIDRRYHALMNPGARVLFVNGSEETGKSRFLRELALLAVYDGHMPVLVSSTSPTIDFKDLISLREALRLAVERTQDQFKVKGPLPSTLLSLEPAMDFQNPPAGLPDPILKELKGAKKLTGRALLLALREELLALSAAARKEKKLNAETGRVLLLIDQLDFMPAEFLEDVFAAVNRRVLGLHGIGVDSPSFTPVVLAAGFDGIHSGYLRAVRDNDLDWLKSLELLAFEKVDNSDLLAFRRVLLQPFDATILDETSSLVWIWNPDAPQKEEGEWIQKLRAWLKRRVPGDFRNELLYSWAVGAEGRNVLRRADDNDLLARLDAP